MGIGALMRYKAVFLDRDGVLNDAVIKEGKPYPPQDISSVTIPDEVLPSLQLLKQAGYLLIGATNQPDVARGTTKREVVDEINNYLLSILPLDEMRVCYHDDIDKCDCRKPKPGLIKQAAHQHQIDLASSYMIGDRWRDITAGQLAGCKTIWLDRQYNEAFKAEKPTYTTISLREAVAWILKQD